MAMSVQLAFQGDAIKQRDQLIPSVRGHCFITTACVISRGLTDNCEELTVLRALRDDHIRPLKNGPALVGHYYRIAPAIVSALDQREDRAEIYDRIYRVVARCVDMTLSREPYRAVEQYRTAVHDLGVMTGVLAQSQPMDQNLISLAS